MAVTFTVPARQPDESTREWHSRFANANGAALHQLVRQTPDRIVVITLDANSGTAKVAIRTAVNLSSLVPKGVAADLDPNKAMILSYDDGHLTASKIEIDAAPENGKAN